ncbi:LysM peptidoglycan-binding domain-containing protein [Candidatus Gottesmanbacteria bacterium]|nr:LysM peptidoglycan-binding domain-containing protein [Candidatus Gottesmanbacteria bacterium]
MWKRLMKELDLSDSYISMGLGLLVVLIVGVLLFNYFSSKSEPEITEEGQQTEEIGQVDFPITHTVIEGETLWSVSEKYFQSGYNWKDIAESNNLSGQESLEVGQQLIIPNVTPILVAQNAVSPSPEPTLVEEPTASQQIDTPQIKGEEISSSNYTVVHGDSLWKIAVAHYNDGYKWVEIARANNLANPDIIHAGNVLILP